MLITTNDEKISLKDLYQGASIFFIGGGPSILKQDLTFLSDRGICSFAVNNVAAKTIHPNFWCCIDNPPHFHANIWNDPTICKFSPYMYSKQIYYDELLDKFKLIRDQPNVYFYTNKMGFDHTTYLLEPVVCFGNIKGAKDSVGERGCRSVMLAALKLIYYLGFRRVFLLGCDFAMAHDRRKKNTAVGKTYSFPQYKHPSGVLTNNYAYRILNKRFVTLAPLFQQANFEVFNCTPNSNLVAFPELNLAEAVKLATEKIENDPNTFGYYGGRENLNRFGR